MTRPGHYYQIMREHRFSLRFLASRILKRVPLAHRFIIINRGRYKMRFYASSLTANIWEGHGYGAEDETFFERYLRPGDTVIDVGANVGTLSLAAASIVGSEGGVTAIEAHPKTYGFLKGNVDLNGFANTRVHNLAIGDRDGTASFSSKPSDDQNEVIRNGSGIDVKMRTLDGLFHNEGRIDLLKIDVEGYEKFVVAGAADLLRVVECVYFESWEEHFKKYDYTTRELITLLENKGLAVYRITPEALHVLTDDYVSGECENLIAIRDMKTFLDRTGLPITQ